MTEIQPMLDAPIAKPKCGRGHKFLCRFTAFIFLLLIAAIAALLFCPQYVAQYTGYPVQQSSADAQKIAELEKRLQSVEARVNAAPTENTATQETPVQSSADLARMKNDMIAMSSALDAVQAQVKQSGGLAAQGRQAVQIMLAETVAFIQLRESVVAGKTYASELAAMRSAVGSDGRFVEPLAKLDPYAAKGVATVTVLQEQLIEAETSADQAIDKSNAHNWWERILAELKGLVSIRPVHGGDATDAFPVMESALAKDDVAGALAAAKTLPPAAQDALVTWRVNTEARLAADIALHDIAAIFASHAQDEAPQVKQ